MVFFSFQKKENDKKLNPDLTEESKTDENTIQSEHTIKKIKLCLNCFDFIQKLHRSLVTTNIQILIEPFQKAIRTEFSHSPKMTNIAALLKKFYLLKKHFLKFFCKNALTLIVHITIIYTALCAHHYNSHYNINVYGLLDLPNKKIKKILNLHFLNILFFWTWIFEFFFSAF
ncbi:hypothetical protein RFI_04504 [Reticulomyxa filosa]|uniref:Uncharacterized protein n=1 Tax=Reticulomyxa filosa TaxID=46433 RepID=X6P308_RETFI|nr:hypothetical protein RFI_04504 [Reticulomyxa filosa]|eukprot:ETO32616.1 hypothetical protein RFI_04504 [Reticulomyxa filosa]